MTATPLNTMVAETVRNALNAGRERGDVTVTVSVFHLDALLAMVPDPPVEPVTVGPLAIDFYRRSVTVDGEPRRLSGLEFGLLWAIARRKGQAVSFEDLAREIWGDTHERLNCIKVRIHLMRGKLGIPRDCPGWVASSPCFGFRIVLAGEAH